MLEHGVYTTFVDFGNTKIELLEPFGDKSPIAGYLEKNPRGGFHHFCYDVTKYLLVNLFMNRWMI